MEGNSLLESKKTPVLEIYHHEVTKILCLMSGQLEPSQASQLIESKFEDDFDYSVAMQKVVRFKIKGDPLELAEQWKSKFVPNNYVEKVEVSKFGEGKKALVYLRFTCVRRNLLLHILQRVFVEKDSYGSNDTLKGKNILLDFSSPNIAKPFHAGHLRSTIIGNFLRNLYKTFGANTVAVNYLGDWGTQYGLLVKGFEKFGSDEELEKDPIKHLFQVYVKINKRVKGEVGSNGEIVIEPDNELLDEARKYFKEMENGTEESLRLWRKFRSLSIKEYKRIYTRLNVEFDVYSGESEAITEVDTALKKLEKIVKDKNGAKVVDLTEYKLGHALIKKKDGATLYITRDVSEADIRYRKYHFDKSIYVVGAQQDYHFQQLFRILKLLNEPYADNLEHVNFGMVIGMKTRTGNVVFLSEILDDAKEKMLEKIKRDDMGKFAEIKDPDAVADILGISAVVIQDLSAKRIRDYNFDLERMTSSDGNTGPYLQYAHARLCSIEDKTADIPLTADIDPDLLMDKFAYQLAIEIGRLHSVLQQCTHNHEPSTLVNYMFGLAKAISVAHGNLRVKGSEIHVAEARKLLLWASRITLHNCLKIIGLIPLSRM